MIAGMAISATAPQVSGESQGAHLWLTIDPGVYVFSNIDPWLVDSYVDPLNYTANGIYFANLTVSNQGTESAETYLLIAIPNSTIPQMFSSIIISGGAGGMRTYILRNFGRTDYNPYVHEKKCCRGTYCRSL